MVDDSFPGVDAVSAASLVDSAVLAFSRVLFRSCFLADESRSGIFVPPSDDFGFGFFMTFVERVLEEIFGCWVVSAPESDAFSGPLIRELRLAALSDGLLDDPASGPVPACEASILTKSQSLWM